MKTITFNNVENLVFLDSKLRNLLAADFSGTFQSWGLAQQEPKLRPLAQKMLILFVNQVEEKHIKIMKEYFNDEVKVERIDANVATHLTLSIHEAEKYLNSHAILKEAIFSYREGDQVYISLWR